MEYLFDSVSDIVGSSGDSFDILDSGSFVGGLSESHIDLLSSGTDYLGDTVGTAGKLISLLKSGTGAASDLFGGGGKDSKGFVPKENTALQEAKRFQTGQIQRQATLKERSQVEQTTNKHSVAIIDGLHRNNEAGLRAFGNQLASIAQASGTRAEVRARATA
tara:strand:+ start:1877 stop:2362 length:486 start_codon:yes stop_codon:yes gene_type:complete